METPRAHFPKKGTFMKELHAEVKAYFEENKLSERNGWAMFPKTLIIMAWVLGGYTAVLIAPVPPVVRLLLCVFLGLGLAALEFNVGHDGNHGAYSTKAWVNNLASLAFDFVGASSFLWRFRHNIVHHTYTNIAGMDHDISSAQPFMRTTAKDPYYFFHRWQHIYAWGLYAFITANWGPSDAQGMYFSRNYGGMPIPKPALKDHVAFWVAKLVVAGWFFGWPYLAGYNFWQMCLGIVLTFGSMGVVMSTVFQLAHVVEPAIVLYPAALEIDVEDEWAVHQLKTSVDFAPNSWFANWYLGGLNYQAIHHLFPRITHVYYPALAPIVARVAAKHGVPYHVMPSVWAAIVSHYRTLKKLAVPATATEAAAFSSAAPGNHASHHAATQA